MTSTLFELNTGRMRIIAATAVTLEAEINDHTKLANLLQAEVPKNWPPELTKDVLAPTAQKLRADPAKVGWYFWYMILLTKPPEHPVVIGICGFKGRPKRNGTVEIGYSVLHQHRKRG